MIQTLVRSLPLKVSHSATLRLWLRNVRTRRDLAVLPPHLLKDVAITPRQAREEARRAFWR